MKKMIPVMMLSGIIGLSACGNKTEQPQQNADTLEVADTIKEDTAAVDTPQTAEVQENAQEEKTVEKNVKSTQAGGTTIAVGEPLAETLRKAKGVTFEYNADYGVACNIGSPSFLYTSTATTSLRSTYHKNPETFLCPIFRSSSM